jgi:5-oxoprolinase (ATP-hydrolysing)
MRVARRHAERELDDGSLIRVAVARDGDRLRVDFTGSAPTHPRNFNAPLAVTTAATLYALRLLVDEPVPMNEGLLRAVDLVVPSGMLNPAFDADPTRCPPVVAGNVETSQSVVAVLVDALELAAESQSTMNNILFGDATFGVYETLGGGAGAGPRRDGASAVHTHMSNTRLTDIEVLERRAPVVVRTLEVRRGSGGAGASRGGDGLVRGYEFLAPVSLSHFASRRRHAPRGVLGGGDGLVGCAKALLSGELREFDAGVLSLELDAGDTFTVFTPGGGGYGAP